MKRVFLLIDLIVLSITLVSAKQYPSSVREASAAENRIRQGWNIEVSGGVGTGAFAFHQVWLKKPNSHVENTFTFPTWDAAIGLNYYFVDWFGLGTGAQFSSYSNISKITVPWVYHHIDQNEDTYVFTATPHNLSESQNMTFLEVPLALKFRAIPNKVGFVGTLGMKFAIPMYNSYNLAEGGYITNQVSYDDFDRVLSNVPGLIEDCSVAPMKGSIAKSSLNKLSYVGFAEVGILIRLHQRVDMNVSLYGNYFLTDVMSDINRSSYGMVDSYAYTKYPSPFTTLNEGILNTKEVKELHPWSAGLRIGFQFNVSRTKAQRNYDKLQRRLKREAKKPKDPLLTHLENIEKRLNTADSVHYQIMRDTIYLQSPCEKDTVVQIVTENKEGKLNMPILTTVKVVKGNRLAQLARKYYHKTDYWVYIYEANKDKLVSPHIIHVGMDLDIPDVLQYMPPYIKETKQP